MVFGANKATISISTCASIAHSFVCVFICGCIFVYACVYACMCMDASFVPFLLYLFLWSKLLISIAKNVCSMCICVCVYVYRVCVSCMCTYLLCYMYVCAVCVCARMRFTRDDNGSLRCAPIFLDEREKGRERPRRESGYRESKHIHIVYHILCVTHVEINKFVHTKIFILPISGTLK